MCSSLCTDHPFTFFSTSIKRNNNDRFFPIPTTTTMLYQIELMGHLTFERFVTFDYDNLLKSSSFSRRYFTLLCGNNNYISKSNSHSPITLRWTWIIAIRLWKIDCAYYYYCYSFSMNIKIDYTLWLLSVSHVYSFVREIETYQN